MDATKKLLNLHMTKLCDVIGARPTGSEANKAAVQYAADTFKDLGLTVTLQEFPCMDWKNYGAQLTLDGVQVEVAAAEYSAPCNVTGKLVCVSNIEELKAADLQNKICVMYGELCKEPLMPKSMTFWNPVEHKEIIRELESKMPLAIITVSFLPNVPVPIIQDGDFNIPCATVTGTALDVLLNSKDDAVLQIITQRQPTTAANVIATYGKGSGKVSFSAHIDTKPTTPGALDNGGGVAVLLALASKIVKTEYPYQIEFALFNGEDYYSNPGEILFMQSYLQNPGDYVCAFNVDGVGMKDSSTSYSFYECPDELQHRIDTFAATCPDIEKIEPWPMGDHMIFAGSGIPAVAVTATHIFNLMEAVMHTPKDNLAIVDMDQLESTVKFLFGCI